MTTLSNTNCCISRSDSIFLFISPPSNRVRSRERTGRMRIRHSPLPCCTRSAGAQERRSSAFAQFHQTCVTFIALFRTISSGKCVAERERGAEVLPEKQCCCCCCHTSTRDGLRAPRWNYLPTGR